jgi:hypothetical protein
MLCGGMQVTFRCLSAVRPPLPLVSPRLLLASTQRAHSHRRRADRPQGALTPERWTPERKSTIALAVPELASRRHGHARGAAPTRNHRCSVPSRRWKYIHRPAGCRALSMTRVRCAAIRNRRQSHPRALGGPAGEPHPSGLPRCASADGRHPRPKPPSADRLARCATRRRPRSVDVI